MTTTASRAALGRCPKVSTAQIRKSALQPTVFEKREGPTDAAAGPSMVNPLHFNGEDSADGEVI